MTDLGQPLCIRGMNLANRLVMPPMASGRATEGGSVRPELLQYYAERVGGIALVITEHAYVSPEGKAHKGQLSLAQGADEAGLASLASVIHEQGAVAIAQISHAGGATTRSVTGLEPLAPSRMRPSASGQELPREASEADIQRLTDDFRVAALRAQDAGFDGVELHAAHGYLLNQFYSPLTNKRTDAYTGSTVKGRIRLCTELILRIREALGEKSVIAVRLGACDYTAGGSSLEDGAAAAVLLEQAGADLLDISGGFCGPYKSDSQAPGYFSTASALIKSRVSIPVLVTGGITEPAQAERLLREGRADLIGVGRALLRDADWARRALGLRNS